MTEEFSAIGTKSIPKSPLSSLRLSNSEFSDVDLDKRKNSLQRNPRRISIKHDEAIKTPQINDGFEPELSLTHIDSNIICTDNPRDKTELKKVNEYASILLDTRKTFQADCNIIDPKDGNSHGNKNHTMKNINNASEIEISRNTLIRAEKVKTMIGLKYLFIQRINEQAQSEDTNHTYKGVIGVYNPLQVIRNRKIRKKYKEYPAPLSLKTLPLACNVFSIHNKDRKKPWKMTWSIELDEFIGDLTWRTSHWHELKNSKGKLWFPSSAQSSPINKPTKQRLHDRIFTDGDSDSGLKASSVHSSATSLSTEENKHNSKPGKRKVIKKQLKKGVVKFYDRGTSSDEAISFSVPYMSNYSSSNLSKGKKGSQNFEEITPSSTELEHNLSSNKDNSDDMISTIAEDNKSDFNLDEVSFKPIVKSKSNELNLATEHIEEIKPQLQLTKDIKEEEFNNIMNKLLIIERIVSLRLFYLIKIYPKLMELSNKKINEIIQQQIPVIFKNIVLINDDYLPQYEDLYSGLSGEIKSVIRMVNTDYSIRIDKLLSNSDRCIGEINTSLSLELRKVNEKLDNLNSLLFRNIVTTSLSIDPTVKLKHGANNNKLVYFLLENFIVVMLRFVWVIVNIYKLIMSIIKALFKLVKYILC